MNGVAYGNGIEMDVKEFYDKMRGGGDADNDGSESGRTAGDV